MKYSCDIEGLEHNYIELSDVWSRKQATEFLTADSDKYLALLKAKIIALSLDCVEGPPVTSAEDLTDDALDDLDMRVFHWLKIIPRGHVQNVLNLGEASGRRSYVTVGETAARMNASPLLN
jgi:hypothetical protein